MRIEGESCREGCMDRRSMLYGIIVEAINKGRWQTCSKSAQLKETFPKHHLLLWRLGIGTYLLVFERKLVPG